MVAAGDTCYNDIVPSYQAKESVVGGEIVRWVRFVEVGNDILPHTPPNKGAVIVSVRGPHVLALYKADEMLFLVEGRR